MLDSGPCRCICEPHPPAHQRRALAALVLRAADLEVLGKEIGRPLAHELALFGRAGPRIGAAGRMQRVGLAFLSEQHERGQRELAVAGDVAAHLGYVAALADHFDTEREIRAYRRDEADLRGAKGRKVGHRLARRLQRERGGSAAEQGAPLHPVFGSGQGDGAAIGGDRVDQVGKSHRPRRIAKRNAFASPVAKAPQAIALALANR
jgi:hypothetical protein